MCVGPGEFISRDPVRLNEWTTIIAERNRNDGSLIINEETAVKGLSCTLTLSTITVIDTPTNMAEMRTSE